MVNKMKYHVGDMIRLTALWTVDKSPTDPTAISLKFKNHAGTETEYIYGEDPEIEKDGTGDYHADIPLDHDGTWHYRWEGTGAAHAAEESSFEVEETEFS
jgi:hypothetical protein